jgi:hypothetical protein
LLADRRPVSLCPRTVGDLDHIDATDRWEVLPVKKDDLPNSIAAPLAEGFRTVVLWEQLDRLLGYRHPYGEFQRKQLAQMSRDLEEHLAMVFHRFLSGEARRRRLKLRLNGNVVQAWDPFCRTELRTRKLQARSIPVAEDDVSGEVLFEPFVLPHQSRFSTPAAHERAAGPRKWNRQQGFYIYRADRLIQSGGWCGLRVQDEHTKLARVALSFTPKLDEAFKINVAKMRVQLPMQIRSELERLLAPVIRAADGEYRNSAGSGSPARPGVTGTGPVPSDTTSADTSKGLGARQPINGAENGATAADLRFTCAEALAVATRKEQPVIRAVFGRLGAQQKNV